MERNWGCAQGQMSQGGCGNYGKELVKYSPEWMADLKRSVDAGQRFIANNKDMDALAEFSDAGTKIGFVKPLPKK